MKKSSLILGKVILSLGLVLNAGMASAGYFKPIITHCVKVYPGNQQSETVGYSNNCIFGSENCVDNSCPEGTMEVQDEMLPPGGY
jgi:hypothetical protein